jgi:6-phosphogluconolactonase (cycloisomerase 2 family)
MRSVLHRHQRGSVPTRGVRRAGVSLMLAAVLCLAGAASASAFSFPIDFFQQSGSPFALGFDSFPNQVAFSPSGDLLATNVASGVDLQSVSAIGTVGAIDGPQGSCTAGESNSVAFSPSGSVLAEAVGTGFGTKGVLVTFAVAGTTLTRDYCYTLGTEASSIDYAVAFSPAAYGGLLAVTNSSANNVSVFSVTSAGKLTPMPGSPFATGPYPGAVAFSPTGSAFDALAIANFGNNSVSMFTVGGGAVAPVPGSPFPVGAQPYSVSFSPNGDLLATADWLANEISVFKVGFTGSLTQVSGSPFATGTGTDPMSATFAPGGTLLASSDYGNVEEGGHFYGYGTDLSVYSVSSAGALAPLPASPVATGSGPEGVAFNPDGFLLADANEQGQSTSVFSYGASYVVALPPWLTARLGSILASLDIGASASDIGPLLGRALAEVDWRRGRNVATVHLAFKRLLLGRAAGGHCVAPMAANDQGPSCTRSVRGETVTLVAHRLTHELTVSRHHRLVRGSDKLVVTATAAGGLRSIPLTLRLTVSPAGAAG